MLDPDGAALLLELVGERLHQDGVLRLPAHEVEVAGRLLVSVVVGLVPAGPQTGLVARDVSGGPGRVHVRRASRSSHCLHLQSLRG